MNLIQVSLLFWNTSIPRVSGDEPGYFGVIYLIDEVFPA